MTSILNANKVNLFVSSFFFCNHSPNFLDTPRILHRTSGYLVNDPLETMWKEAFSLPF
jgi:hypothetical protein